MVWTLKSSVTETEYAGLEDEDRKIHDALMAIDEDDWNRAMEHVRDLDEIPAEALMGVKRTWGAQAIKDLGVKTHTAEAKYGPNWLEN